MGFRRIIAPPSLPRGEKLTAAMVGIGINLAAEAARAPNIEDTLLAASVEGMEHDDLRVLALLVTWLDIHHPWINADRLHRAASVQRARRTRAFWAAVGGWLKSDRRLARLVTLHEGPRIDLLRTGTEFQLQRRGEDQRFSPTVLRVPAGVLRHRPVDVLAPTDLAKRHPTYRCRILIGPSYRADMWAALEREPSLSAAQLARRTYGSFATAWQVKRDRDLLLAA
jgi:hypothetical protein